MTERDQTAVRLEMLRTDYARLRDEAALARTQMLSDRLTHSRKEAQRREAEVEEADDQADYFADRVQETAATMRQSEATLAVLEGRVNAVRGEIVVAQIAGELDAFAAALRDLAPQVAAMLGRLEAAATHIRQATALAEELPSDAAAASHTAITAATERFIAVEGLLRDLYDALHNGR